MGLGKLQRPHCDRALEIMVNKRNYPHMALIQISEILEFTQMGVFW